MRGTAYAHRPGYLDYFFFFAVFFAVFFFAGFFAVFFFAAFFFAPMPLVMVPPFVTLLKRVRSQLWRTLNRSRARTKKEFQQQAWLRASTT